jgi:hypothetical protein
MSTIQTFREISGMSRTSSLEITPDRAQEIIETISSNHPPGSRSTSINILPVSSYVNHSKTGSGVTANISPNRPPFASHWGIVVGKPEIKESAYLFHLVLVDEGGKRDVKFRCHNVGLESKSIKGHAVKQVGETKFGLMELTKIGLEMIEAFGNYHVVFWNCQMFAKCYLRVITGSDAAFTEWTTTDVVNLFLCSFVVSLPIASTSKATEDTKMKKLEAVGAQAAGAQAARERLISESQSEVTEEDLLKASDEAISLMKMETADDEIITKSSGSAMVTSDKRSLIQRLKLLWSRWSDA